MRKLILISAILILIIGLGGFLYSMISFPTDIRGDAVTMGKLRQEDTAIYIIDLPAGLDTIAFNTTIRFDSKKLFHKIKLPNGGTETNVYIYDSTFMNNIEMDSKIIPQPITSGDFLINQDVLFDISSFNKGTYYIHYLSCGFGGVFSLTIK